jgi:chromosome segregation ATPase
MFKKTVPQAESFLQVRMSMSARSKAKSKTRSKAKSRAKMGLLAMSGLTSGKGDQFAELKKMITKMISDMKQEQKDDDNHRQWCQKEIDLTEDSIKVVQETTDTHNQKMAEKNNELSTLQEAMATVKKEIKDLDLNMLIATAQRKKEKSEYDQVVSEITISLSLLKKARDRMAAFYEKPSLIAEHTQTNNVALSQVETMFGFSAPPPPPSASGYTKKSGQATGILGMLDSIRQDLKVEQKEVEMEEKSAIEDYDETMADSKESKEAKEKDVIAKEGAISRIVEEIVVEKKGLATATDEMLSLRDKMSVLHESCDFLLANYDIRKKARSAEIEGLQKSIAILSGADFGGAAAASLLQIRSAMSHHLRRKDGKVTAAN